MVLKRYIFSQLFLLTCLIALVLTGALWLTQSLRFVDVIVTRGVSFALFLQFIFFLLPDLMVLALPIAFLIAILVVYNKLIADHELVVMRTGGCSDFFLITPVLTLAVGLMIFLYSLTLYVLPLSFQQFRKMELHLRHHHSSAMIRSGEFNHLDNVMIYARHRSQDGVLQGLLLHDGRDPNHLVTVTAEKGFVLDEGEGVKFVLRKGSRQEIDRKNKRPSFLKFDQYVLKLQAPKKTEAPQAKPYEMTFFQLFKPNLSFSPGLLQKLRSEVHQRLISPLYVLSFGLLAVIFLLQVSGQRSGHPLRIFSIVLLCALIQGGSLGLLQQTASSFFTTPFAYALVLSPLLLFIFQFSKAGPHKKDLLCLL